MKYALQVYTTAFSPRIWGLPVWDTVKVYPTREEARQAEKEFRRLAPSARTRVVRMRQG